MHCNENKNKIYLLKHAQKHDLGHDLDGHLRPRVSVYKERKWTYYSSGNGHSIHHEGVVAHPLP